MTIDQKSENILLHISHKQDNEAAFFYILQFNSSKTVFLA